MSIIEISMWAIFMTLSGSILAFALANGKTIDECRNIYFKLKVKQFSELVLEIIQDVVFTHRKSGIVDYDTRVRSVNSRTDILY